MKSNTFFKTFSIGWILLMGTAGFAQQEFIRSTNIDASVFPDEILTETVVLDGGYGIFENAATLVYEQGRIRNDTDQPSRASAIQFDPETGEYLIYSNGNDVWDNEDATAYLWTTRPGSHRMTVRVRWIQDGGSNWAKAGIMSRIDPTDNASASMFWQFRGAEDGTEPGRRNWRLAPTTQNLLQTAQHETSVFIGGDAHEPVWLRLTRIWPSNQIIYEDADEFTLQDLGVWDQPVQDFGAFFLPEEMNWGIWGFDHVGTNVAFPDAVLIDNVLLEPIVGGNRILEESHFSPGSPLNVTLLLNNPGDPTAADISETVPDGWTVSNISDGGSSSGNTITWTLNNFSGNQEVSYTVTPGADATDGAFEGTVNDIQTAGPELVGAAPDSGSSLGDFDGVSNIGGADGSATFADGTYSILSNGNLTGTEDSLNFIWKRVTGDFSLQAFVDPFGPDAVRAGLMVRDSLAANSSFMFINLSPTLQVRMQSRDVAGKNAFAQRGATWYPGIAQRNGFEFPGGLVDQTLRLERVDGQLIVSFGDLGRPDEEPFTVYGAGTIVGSDPLYIGIATASGGNSPDAEVTVNNVELIGDETHVEQWSLF